LNHKKLSIYYCENLLNKKQKNNFELHLKTCHFCQNIIKNYSSFNTEVIEKTKKKIKVNSADKTILMNKIINLEPAVRRGYAWFPKLRWAISIGLVILGILIYLNVKQPISVLSYKGDIYIQKTGQKELMQSGSKIRQNCIVSTDADSDCYLSFGKNIIFLGNNTQVIMQKLKKNINGTYQIKLRVEKGVLLSNIRDKATVSSLIIQAGQSTAYIKGTVFMVDCRKKSRQTIAVLNGNVNVRREGIEFSLKAEEKLVMETQKTIKKSSLTMSDERQFAKILMFPLYFKKNWEQEIGDLKDIKINEDKNYFYITSKEGKFICLIKDTGTVKYRIKIGAKVSSQPLFYNGHIYISSSDGYLYCLSEGDIKWRKRYGPFVYSSPVQYNNKLYTANTEGRLTSIDADTGQKFWQVKLDSQFYSTPLIKKQKLIIGSITGKLYCINVKSGNTLWIKNLERRIIDNTSFIVDNNIIIGTSAGKIYKLSLKNGNISWERTVSGEINTSLILIKDKFYVKANKLYSFDLKGNLLWEQSIHPESNIYSSSNSLLIEDPFRLVRLDLSSGKKI